MSSTPAPDALRAENVTALHALFADDATWTSDGGGKVKPARKVVQGVDGPRVAWVLTIDTDGLHILAAYVIVNPDKLAGIAPLDPAETATAR